MICVVVLQNDTDVVEGETGIMVGEAINIKDEFPEAITFPQIKTEQEVRLWGLCEVVAAQAFRSFMAPRRNCKITLNYFLLCVVLWVPYTF
jgi:hypothetical protein